MVKTIIGFITLAVLAAIMAAPNAYVAANMSLGTLSGWLVAARSQPILTQVAGFGAVTAAAWIGAGSKGVADLARASALTWAAAWLGLSIGLSIQPQEPSSNVAQGFHALNAVLPSLMFVVVCWLSAVGGLLWRRSRVRVVNGH